MPTTQQLRKRLLEKLKELFQLNQPDLDFGFYRIMHAKAEQVERFIEEDLLQVIADTFGQADEKRRAAVKFELDQAIQQALDFGAPDPEKAPAVMEARKKYDLALVTESVEGDIYDHLYRFFERYYDGGDFISRRYYARETPGKAAPFAIPYNGEEVKLHWANADQYYIKTAEHFSNYTVDLNQAKEIREARESGQADLLGGTIKDEPARVHFRIVDASEGEHGNIKASDNTKRFFMIYKKNPIEINESGELIINFEYRPDPDRTGQEGSWRDKLNAEAVEVILAALKKQVSTNPTLEAYLQLFSFPAPTEKDKKRPLLAKYINKYTARNTMDYFIHKDLGGFLSRELDFYIKNEFMRLDDIMDANAPAVESYLDRIKVFRKIACQLIDFLAQLENFQKKLWLKKKFVVETSWCIRLDQVPEEFFPEIASNRAQLAEWDELHGDSWKAADKDLVDAGVAVPLTSKIRVPATAMIDTRHFNDELTARLLDAMEDLEEKTDGLLVHSENFQALNFMQERYREQVSCCYIDPPFNLKDNGDFLYRTDYKDSTWCTLLYDRIRIGKVLLTKYGYQYCRCDINGNFLVRMLIDCLFGSERFEAELLVQRIRKNVTGQGNISMPLANDSLFLYSVSAASELVEPFLKLANARAAYWRRIDDSAGYRNPPERTIFGARFLPFKRDAHFKYSQDSIDRMTKEGRIRLRCKTCGEAFTSGSWVRCPHCNGEDATPQYLVEETDKQVLDTNWLDIAGYAHTTGFSTENAPVLLRRAIKATSASDSVIIDYFAGSGTTAQATIELNREDGGNRKTLSIEIGEHFDTVIIPRLKKITFSPEWKDGKPKRLPTKEEAERSPRLFKIIRLESYEDTLNNLVIAEKRVDDLPKGLQKEFTLSYMLDVETRSSPSLLNLDAFADPTAYTLTVKKPGSEEYTTRTVDLIETFNYLIGLRVENIAAPVTLDAKFKREEDPELPDSKATKLIVDGKIREAQDGPWWFRKVEGWVPADPLNPNNGHKDRVLIVWRKLNGDLEKDNLMLDEWFTKIRVNPRDREFDIIYVNGSNNLQNVATEADKWKVRLIEEEFMKKMWEEAEG